MPWIGLDGPAVEEAASKDPWSDGAILHLFLHGWVFLGELTPLRYFVLYLHNFLSAPVLPFGVDVAALPCAPFWPRHLVGQLG